MPKTKIRRANKNGSKRVTKKMRGGDYSLLPSENEYEVNDEGESINTSGSTNMVGAGVAIGILVAGVVGMVVVLKNK